MTAAVSARMLDNARHAGAEPRLSVLTPFYRDDPRPLLSALDQETATLAGEVELVLLDDAGGDPVLSRTVADAAMALTLPTRLVQLAANAGRARGRNQLMAHSRGRHLLFLDSDMLPDRPVFLSAYLALIAAEDPAVAVGGFSVDQAARRPEHALHRALALRSDCLPAALRQRMPEKYVWTSNLLVRRDVFERERFDEAFQGWGWEDTEWGVRVAARYGVRHIDNQATHLGLDTASALAGKYEQSPSNFARILARHPRAVRRFPSYRLARFLKAVPGRSAWRPMLRRLALEERAPLSSRVAAMKLYRAALYADVV
ncbi:glycosyltransferase family A protein [Caulobacter sp. S45]|uniref:glycosyltransferase family 2 protein n=1 Tax=Caulobacter sp. S45 TaxID=1641861 RepID=UPI00273A34B7|nr:glycosyltransferase family A protein [Caulobacter sp. S45]